MTQEMVVKEETAVATVDDAPSFVDLDEIDSNALIIPRLNLLQKMSDPVELGYKVGTYHNNLTNENYGEQVRFIPLKIKSGAIYMTKDDGLVCKSVDGVTSVNGDICKQCPHSCYHGGEWVNDKPPLCQPTFDITCLETSTMQPMVFTFKSTAYKEGRKVVSNLKMLRQARAVTLASRDAESPKGKYKVPTFASLSPLTQEEIDAATEWKQSLTSKTVEVHEETN